MPPSFILSHHTNTYTQTNININKVLPKAVPRPITLVRSNAFLKVPNAKCMELCSSTFHLKVYSCQCKAKSTGLLWPYKAFWINCLNSAWSSYGMHCSSPTKPSALVLATICTWTLGKSPTDHGLYLHISNSYGFRKNIYARQNYNGPRYQCITSWNNQLSFQKSQANVKQYLNSRHRFLWYYFELALCPVPLPSGPRKG